MFKFPSTHFGDVHASNRMWNSVDSNMVARMVPVLVPGRYNQDPDYDAYVRAADIMEWGDPQPDWSAIPWPSRHDDLEKRMAYMRRRKLGHA